MDCCRRIAGWMIPVALAASAAAPADAATIVLEDFESYAIGADPSNPPGIVTAGDVTVQDATFGVTPSQGSQQLLLTNSGGAVSTAATESAMGLAGGTIQGIFDQRIVTPGLSTGSGPTEGSAFQITFTAQAGDVFEFDWDFLTNEVSPSPGNDPPNPSLDTDFGWYLLELPDATTSSDVLSHANDPSASFISSASSFLDETGYNTTSITLGQTGSFTLTLGVHDVQDLSYDSGLIIDFFRLVLAPEPGTFGTVAGGLIALSWISRRR